MVWMELNGRFCILLRQSITTQGIVNGYHGFCDPKKDGIISVHPSIRFGPHPLFRCSLICSSRQCTLYWMGNFVWNRSNRFLVDVVVQNVPEMLRTATENGQYRCTQLSDFRGNLNLDALSYVIQGGLTGIGWVTLCPESLPYLETT